MLGAAVGASTVRRKIDMAEIVMFFGLVGVLVWMIVRARPMPPYTGPHR